MGNKKKQSYGPSDECFTLLLATHFFARNYGSWPLKHSLYRPCRQGAVESMKKKENDDRCRITLDLLTDILFPERAPFHSLPSQSLITLTSRYLFTWPLRVPTWNTPRFARWNLWLFRGVNAHQIPRMLSPAKLFKFGGGAPGSGAPAYGALRYSRTWVHLFAFSRWWPAQLLFSCLRKSLQLAASLA